jgi:hypothetical protein
VRSGSWPISIPNAENRSYQVPILTMGQNAKALFRGCPFDSSDFSRVDIVCAAVFFHHVVKYYFWDCTDEIPGSAGELPQLHLIAGLFSHFSSRRCDRFFAGAEFAFWQCDLPAIATAPDERNLALIGASAD